MVLNINNLKNNLNRWLLIDLCCHVIKYSKNVLAQDYSHYLPVILWVSNVGWVYQAVLLLALPVVIHIDVSHLMGWLDLGALAILPPMSRWWWWLLVGARVSSRVFQTSLHSICLPRKQEWELQGLLKPKLHICTLSFLQHSVIKANHKASSKVRNGKINSILDGGVAKSHYKGTYIHIYLGMEGIIVPSLQIISHSDYV